MTTSVLISSGKAAEAAAPFPVLTWLILLPLFGSIAVAVLSNRRPEYIKLVAALVSVATGALSLWMLGQFSSHDGGFQFVSQHDWISRWGISWHLGVDGISLFLVVLTSALTFSCSSSSLKSFLYRCIS